MTTNHLNIAVMASGKGSNLQVLLDAIAQGTCPGRVTTVICNKKDAGALNIARNAGVAHVLFINPKDYASRDLYDMACAEAITQSHCAWIVLAGYMRILSAAFVQRFAGHVVNIHPSLLPAFVGGDAVGDALRHGVKLAGCTVHLVTEDLDGGPILAQAVVPVLDDDNWHTLHQRIQIEEHRIYPSTITALLTQSFHIEGRRVIWSAT